MILDKFCLIILVIILIFIYIYVKKENFTTTQPIVQQPTSVQLRNEIGRVLGISPIRIYDLKYEGDLSLNTLNVSFDILDVNENKSLLNEISKNDASKIVSNLTKNDNFFVKINNKTIILRNLLPKDSSGLVFFDNEGLKDIAKYANDKYISVPNDESLTKFYTLGYDKNYNLVPKI